MDTNDASSANDDELNCVPGTDEFYEMTSKRGNILGKVKVVKTNVGELVHGKELGKDERKVLVVEVYNSNKTEAEEEEFFEGAIVLLNKIMVRKLPFKKEGSKKKGRGHKIGMSPQKWTRNKSKKLRNSGKMYISSSGKQISAKNFNDIECKCKYKQCHKLTKETRQTYKILGNWRL